MRNLRNIFLSAAGILRPLVLAVFVMGCTLASVALAPEEVENVHVKNRTRFVSDMAGVLSPETVTRADSLLSSMWQQSSAEPVVVIVPDLSGDDIDSYATELFSLWGIGKKDKDNGVLVLISINDRRAAIRTGYGAEEFLPDVLASNIIRHNMSPRFKEGDYDGGVLASLSTINAALTSDAAREELMSEYANDADAKSASDDDEFFSLYIGFSLAVALFFAVVVVYLWISTRKLPTAQAYKKFESWKIPMVVGTFVGLGVPALFLLVYFLLRRNVRLHKRLCPNCGTRMKRVDEEHDNLYLTPAQDMEERVNSVDYDVWLCPNCNEKDIIPYVNNQSAFSECPVCHARTLVKTSDRVTRQPSEFHEGEGVKTYDCLNCRHRITRAYTLPKIVPVIIPGGGGGRGGSGFGGGGFSGGSFGGGMTGGGGASGGW